ncbi:hypothetical protein W97_02705 [Coniosporium apollinis CBS 100218]|uniref:Uncharacterized protein n=1 Tax=Coniosporium apollinis (strain CBS 100218) TaxID=1168221 RepID=R7YNK6_CONA1|nr:uncharacterized protein W97_02705 [Coniosporium apollinis CBS 100218]EON63477.1 hypothetical protein W97_02705 [Coniosporium apollinis CBS 100218]
MSIIQNEHQYPVDEKVTGDDVKRALLCIVITAHIPYGLPSIRETVDWHPLHSPTFPTQLCGGGAGEA